MSQHIIDSDTRIELSNVDEVNSYHPMSNVQPSYGQEIMFADINQEDGTTTNTEKEVSVSSREEGEVKNNKQQMNNNKTNNSNYIDLICGVLFFLFILAMGIWIIVEAGGVTLIILGVAFSFLTCCMCLNRITDESFARR